MGHALYCKLYICSLTSLYPLTLVLLFSLLMVKKLMLGAVKPFAKSHTGSRYRGEI